MDFAVAADRDVYIEAISTVSPYDDQHTQAANRLLAWGVWYRACFSSSHVYGYEWDVI